jgi:pimeloyl-ACP methyl ester carboxylesterase
MRDGRPAYRCAHAGYGVQTNGSVNMDSNARDKLSRRGLLAASAVAAAGIVAVDTNADAATSRPDPMVPVPIPAQAPAKEGMATLPDTRLWYWDTGGTGQPIVLTHPATGSALIWGYQQPAFAKAGYRVIGYSRRGYINSAPFDKDKPGNGSVDLLNLMEFLGIRKFHLVASAAGGSIASDFAFSYSDRLYSLTISSNSFGVRDGEIAKAAAFIRPKGWDDMPAEFRELGPSYRAANPEGVKRWMELEHKALIGPIFRQPLKNDITQARLRELKVPTLIISGAADMSTSPAMARMLAAEIPNSEIAYIPEAGHSSYWEQPELFNRAVLEFIAKHGK